MTRSRAVARVAVPSSAAIAATLLAIAPAAAHVSVTPSSTEAGTYTVATVAVPHGCDGSPTTRVAIALPEQVLSVTPSRNPFWDVEVIVERLAEPATDAHGNRITERDARVVYTARQPLPDGVRDSFELSFQVPDTPGQTLVFPTVQTCARGATPWTEVPAPGQDAHDLETPAPSFAVTTPDDPQTAAEIVPSSPAPVSGAGEGGNAMGSIGMGAGLLGLLAGLVALATVRRRT